MGNEEPPQGPTYRPHPDDPTGNTSEIVLPEKARSRLENARKAAMECGGGEGSEGGGEGADQKKREYQRVLRKLRFERGELCKKIIEREGECRELHEEIEILSQKCNRLKVRNEKQQEELVPGDDGAGSAIVTRLQNFLKKKSPQSTEDPNEEFVDIVRKMRELQEKVQRLEGVIAEGCEVLKDLDTVITKRESKLEKILAWQRSYRSKDNPSP